MKNIIKSIYWVAVIVFTIVKASSLFQAGVWLVLFLVGFYIIRGIVRKFTTKTFSDEDQILVGPPDE